MLSPAQHCATALIKMGMLPTCFACLCASAAAFNAASVWGIAPNSSYFPKMANIIFQKGLLDIDLAHRTTGATGLYQIRWTEPTLEKKAKGWCESPIPRFHNTTDCVTMRADKTTLPLHARKTSI